jgi:hypothetical protein
MANGSAQQLYGSNISSNIGEALEARTKDPLWFLARQWQSGEFEAANGGRLAYLTVTTRENPLETVTIGGSGSAVNLDDPLEELIERESASGDAPAWQSEALEYAFGAETAAHRLSAHHYAGRALDWYNFDVAAAKQAVAPAPVTRQMTPTQLYFPGAPSPRWWRFEDGDASFDEPTDPEPNALSMLLPEFFYADIANWYVLPVPMTAGGVREVVSVTAVDSFGIVADLPPVDQSSGQWRVFVLDGAEGTDAKALSGQFLFAPNIALDILYNDEIEDVRFIRDEDASLVWAAELRYRTPSGETVINGDGQPLPSAAAAGEDGLPRFRLNIRHAGILDPLRATQERARFSSGGRDPPSSRAHQRGGDPSRPAIPVKGRCRIGSAERGRGASIGLEGAADRPLCPRQRRPAAFLGRTPQGGRAANNPAEPQIRLSRTLI